MQMSVKISTCFIFFQKNYVKKVIKNDAILKISCPSVGIFWNMQSKDSSTEGQKAVQMIPSEGQKHSVGNG
jgi:hypothetical protein